MKLEHARLRLTWIILGASLLLSLAAAAIIAQRDIDALGESHQALAQSLSRQLARAGHLALLAGNQAELQEIARSVLNTAPVIGSVVVKNAQDESVVTLVHPDVALWLTDRWAARISRVLAGTPLRMSYAAQIPPAGEGSLLDPFGTPRADIGKTVLHLSSSQYTRELAQSLYDALLTWLLLFLLLATTGYSVALLASLPLLRLRQGLSALTGDERQTDTVTKAASTNYADIERSLSAIGQRLSRSEDEARIATEALQGQAQQLEVAQQHARSAARMRADLVAGMSHELRTPLTAILGHSALLARTTLNKHQKNYVATMRKSAQNLLHLIDDVLEWSGIEAGKANLNDIGFNLAEIVEDTVDLLAPLAFEKDLDLTHMIFQDVPLPLRGDPQRFQQILTNLVSNAIKFTTHGGVTIRIMLEDEDDNSVVVRASVADTGPGIASEQQHRLFDMYERLDDVATVGTGLGLAISKRLLELMDGEISVESQPGKGSDFQFVLPLKKATRRKQDTAPLTDIKGLRVWIQDDHATARLALAHHLEAWHTQIFEMDTRANFQACLEDAAPALTPDLAIIGLRASQTHDIAVLALLAACRAANLPVLALVTSIDTEVHTTLEHAGASLCLPKSTNRLQLYRKICDLLGLSANKSSQHEAPPLAGIQCLIADNSSAARGYLAALLGSLGAGVAQAQDGQAAVTAWRKGYFPLIILDEQMPELTGAQASQKIRQLATAQTQPVIIGVTADSRPDVHQRLMQAGMDGSLIKPFDEQQLLRLLEPLLTNGKPQANQTSDNVIEQTGSVALSEPSKAGHLISDPELGKLLCQELPAQFHALNEALDAAELQRSQAEIHTLHGTAAFYGLSDIKSYAMAIETTLQAGTLPEAEDIQKLEAAVARTVDSLTHPVDDAGSAL